MPEVQASGKGTFAPNNPRAGLQDPAQGVAARMSECKRQIFVFWCSFLFGLHVLPIVPTAARREHRSGKTELLCAVWAMEVAEQRDSERRCCRPSCESNLFPYGNIPFPRQCRGSDFPVFQWFAKPPFLSPFCAGEIWPKHRRCAYVSRQPFSTQLARQQVPVWDLGPCRAS